MIRNNSTTLVIDKCYHQVDDNDGTSLNLGRPVAGFAAYHYHFTDQVDGMSISSQVCGIYHAHDGPAQVFKTIRIPAAFIPFSPNVSHETICNKLILHKNQVVRPL